jgi:hypothetical protein
VESLLEKILLNIYTPQYLGEILQIGIGGLPSNLGKRLLQPLHPTPDGKTP